MATYKSYLKSFIPFFLLLATIILCRTFSKDITYHEPAVQDTVEKDNSSQTIPFSEGLVMTEINQDSFSPDVNYYGKIAGNYSVKPVGVHTYWMIPIFRKAIVKQGSATRLRTYTDINPN